MIKSMFPVFLINIWHINNSVHFSIISQWAVSILILGVILMIVMMTVNSTKIWLS